MNTPIQQANRRFELLWWVITALILVVVLTPVYLYAKATYPFWWYNMLYVVAFITLSRYLFWLRFTFLAKKQKLKIVVALLCLPLAFYLVEGIYYFQEYIDNEGLMILVEEAPVHLQVNLGYYIKNQYVLFGVGSIVSTGAFAIRLIISVWRLHNRGTV